MELLLSFKARSGADEFFKKTDQTTKKKKEKKKKMSMPQNELLNKIKKKSGAQL